jgi:hypothetical protein
MLKTGFSRWKVPFLALSLYLLLTASVLFLSNRHNITFISLSVALSRLRIITSVTIMAVLLMFVSYCDMTSDMLGKQVPAKMNKHTREELPFLCKGEVNTPL